MIDILIVGNGPAGLSAALYGIRAGYSVCIVGKDNGALAKAEKVDNYFAVPGLSGREIIQRGKDQVENLGGKLVTDEVINIKWDGFFKVTAKFAEYNARSVIIATGAARQSAKISGIKELEGRGVSHCAVCDGFFYKDKDVAVLGNGIYALHEANELLHIARSVTVITNGEEPTVSFPEIYKIINVPVKNIKVKDTLMGQMLEGVVFSDGEEIDINGLFIALGSASAVDLARKMGVEIRGNSIAVDGEMKTNISGLYAAGDCTGGMFQVSLAVSEGTKAALSAIAYLRENPVS